MDKPWRPNDWPPPLPYLIKRIEPLKLSQLGDPLDWLLAGIVSLATIGVIAVIALSHPAA